MPIISTSKLWVTAVIATFLLMLFACGGEHGKAFTQLQRKKADSLVEKVGLDSYDSIYAQASNKGNTLLRIVVLRNWGEKLRNMSEFGGALLKHGEGLELAKIAGDTIELMRALNNIGTDYRRMGVPDAAQKYHYEAWTLAKVYRDTSFVAKKNRVMSLNGLANVYLTVGNLQRADSALRMALAGEIELGSLVGQAINYANIGSIFESREQTDSAWTYYKRSMDLNVKSGNVLGISLCHNHFGKLYEKTKEYDKAEEEYLQAYNMMRNTGDKWHMLEPLMALAGISFAKGDNAETEAYLKKGLALATEIDSRSHLEEIYTLYYRLFERRGEWHNALQSHKRATAIKDSMINMERVNAMQNASLSIERGQQTKLMSEVRHELKRERLLRHVGFVTSTIIVVLLAGIIIMLIYTRRVRLRSHAALKRLSHVREMFFTNITHEFRTPLTVILGLGRELQQSSISSDEVQDMGRTIERQGQGLLRLVNQLLDISRVRSAIGAPSWRNGNIIAFVGMVVEAFESYADSRNIDLKFVAQEKELDTGFVPDYVSKLLSNLLSNAIKFTPSDGNICVSIWRKDGNVCIDVSDTGRGIPPESLPHVFEPFYQSDNVEGSKGTGVGLALVNQIVAALGGKISVDSKENIGTTFHVSLPIRRVEAPALSTEDNRVEEIFMTEEKDGDTEVQDCVNLSRQRALVVEDNVDVAKYIGRELGTNYSVVYAMDGQQGVEKAREFVPDVIITDLMMPVMDGLELCRQIRADELTNHIPIIVVTAKVSVVDRMKGMEAGADAYLSKPFSSEELLVVVKRLLDQRRLLRDKYINENNTAKEAGKEPVAVKGINSDFVDRVKENIGALLDAGKPMDVNAVADVMCVSYSQLYRKLLATTGLTPVQYIQRMKVERAKDIILKSPGKSLGEVAERCGFTDYSNFVRVFRNAEGCTPTQFQKSKHSLTGGK